MRVSSYSSAVRYLESLIPDPAKKRRGNMRLERIEHLLRLIGNPQNFFKSIHIGGTSGKGSTAYITAAILKEAGHRVGLHISPHLEKINERMQCNSKSISDEEFTKLVQWIKPYVERVEKEGEFGKPSYFEVLVALSFEYFKRKKVDIAIVEVGLGGMLDATNVLKPEVAIITNVALDHTEILGNTVEKIACDKAGIIKEGINVVTAAKQKSVLEIIKKRCKEKYAHLTVIGKDVTYQILKYNLNGLVIHLPTFNFQLSTRLLGRHQAENIVCAISALQKIQDTRHKIQTKTIRKALYNLSIPGRLEVVYRRESKVKGLPRGEALRGQRSVVVLDGAHNPAKMKALVSALKELFPGQKISFIFAAKKGKDAEAMLRLLAPITEKFYFTKFFATTDFGKNQSMPPEALTRIMKKINSKISVEIVSVSEEALKLSTFNFQLTCVTGSLYLVGEVRSSLLLRPLSRHSAKIFGRSGN